MVRVRMAAAVGMLMTSVVGAAASEGKPAWIDPPAALSGSGAEASGATPPDPAATALPDAPGRAEAVREPSTAEPPHRMAAESPPAPAAPARLAAQREPPREALVSDLTRRRLGPLAGFAGTTAPRPPAPGEGSSQAVPRSAGERVEEPPPTVRVVRGRRGRVLAVFTRM
jgi:hypothetical protein